MFTLVSAVIVTHNRLPLLKRAIESVRRQNYPNIELIVVDDNSTDGTSEYCQSLSDITYIRIPAEESRGGNHARNVGILKAKGEYVALLDDDDYWLSDKISKQMELMKASGCNLIHCGRILEKVNEGITSYENALPAPSHRGDLSKNVLFMICAVTSTILVKREELIRAGLFDENLSFWQEYELTIRLAQQGRFDFVNEPLVIYRIDTDDKARLTNKFYPWRKAVRYIRKKHKNLYSSLSLKDRIHVRELYCRDAWHRSKSSKLPLHRLWYRGNLWVINLIKGCYRLLPNKN